MTIVSNIKSDHLGFTISKEFDFIRRGISDKPGEVLGHNNFRIQDGDSGIVGQQRMDEIAGIADAAVWPH